MFYTYNYASQNWLASEQDIYQPLFTPFSVKQKKAWCSIHKKWECCGKNEAGRLFYECGLPVPSQFASVNNWTISKIELNTENARDLVNIRVDLVLTDVEDSRKKYWYGYKTWAFYVRTGAVVPYKSEKYLEKFKIKLPESVVKEIQNRLSFYAEKTLGFKCSNSSPKKGIDALADFVTCPACPQISDLQSFLGKDYSRIINRKSQNPYQDLCSYIHVKPFKRMRRIFDKNPLALPVYGILKTWGFKDVNVMTTFLEDSELCRTYFQKVVFNSKTRRIEMKDGDSHGDLFYFLNEYSRDIVTVVNRWCTESFQVQNEKTTMRHLIKAMKDGYHNFFDAAQMYYSRGAAVPKIFKDRIVKKCFTIAVHDELVRIFPSTYDITPYQNKTISYIDSDKILETNMEGKQGELYEFILPKDTDELIELGTIMHNCVGKLYRNKVLNRSTNIVAVKIMNKFCACIEIRTNSKSIVQAKGMCNKPITNEVCQIIKKWAAERDISICTGDIK